MFCNSYLIDSVKNIGKYAEFKLADGRIVCGKYGYFSSTLNAVINQFGEIPKPPYRVRLDELGEDYFHVEKIFHKGVWVGVKKESE